MFSSFFSGEFLLTRYAPQRNGGGTIFLRSIYITLIVAIITTLVSLAPHAYSAWCNPIEVRPTFAHSFCGWLKYLGTPFWETYSRHGTLLAGVFAGTYTALYARFASQWQYLADLYNQIKAKEIDLANNKECEIAKYREMAINSTSDDPINTCCNPAHLLAEWKIGFIEDANTLHLSNKPPFENVVKLWNSDEVVRAVQAHQSP